MVGSQLFNSGPDLSNLGVSSKANCAYGRSPAGEVGMVRGYMMCCPRVDQNHDAFCRAAQGCELQVERHGLSVGHPCERSLGTTAGCLANFWWRRHLIVETGAITVTDVPA